MREDAGFYAVPKLEYDETMKDIKQLAAQIREKKAIMRQEQGLQNNSTKPVMPRTTAARGRDRSLANFCKEMNKLGVEPSDSPQVCNIIVNIVLASKRIH